MRTSRRSAEEDTEMNHVGGYCNHYEHGDADSVLWVIKKMIEAGWPKRDLEIDATGRAKTVEIVCPWGETHKIVLRRLTPL